MMRHRKVEELLAVYRSLDADERRLVDAHVQTCPSCTARLAAYGEIDRALLALPSPAPDRRLRSRYLDTVAGHAGTTSQSRQSSHLALHGLPLFAAVALVLVLGIAAVFMMLGFVRTPSVQPKVVRPVLLESPTPSFTPYASPVLAATLTPSAVPGIVERDMATAAALTPLPSVTYSPAFATQEAAYAQSLATQTAQALLTPSPAATTTPTLLTPVPAASSFLPPIPATEQQPADILGIELSPPSEDQVLLARADGALVVRGLADGREWVVLDPGRYLPSPHSDYLFAHIYPVRISPDGKWLLAPTVIDGTWLVSLDGRIQRRVSDRLLQATWAPDSQQIVFPNAPDPNGGLTPGIYIQDVVNGGAPSLLSNQQGWAPAWSPGCNGQAQDGVRDCGRNVATFYCETPDATTRCTVSLIDTDSGATRVLGYFAPTGFEVSPSEFGWSADGSAVLTRNSLGDWLFPIDGSEPQAKSQGCWPHCSALSPSGVLRAWPGFAFPAKAPDSQPPITSKIVVARVDTGASVVWEREFNGFDFHWTSDGRRLLIAESGGQRDVIWSLDPASPEMEIVARDVVRLGTLEELRQRSTSILPE